MGKEERILGKGSDGIGRSSWGRGISRGNLGSAGFEFELRRGLCAVHLALNAELGAFSATPPEANPRFVVLSALHVGDWEFSATIFFLRRPRC
ncbi:hypothetical protein HN51_051847, partial [Arachis hypogaea]